MWQHFASLEIMEEDSDTTTCLYYGSKIHFNGEPRIPAIKRIENTIIRIKYANNYISRNIPR